MRRFVDFTEKMELQERLKGDWTQCFCSQEANSSLLEGVSDPYCSFWADAEQTRVHKRSFATDARMRLDSLKSECNSPLPRAARDGTAFDFSPGGCWDSDDSQEEESALDSVELLDVEEDVKDEEKWLYESQKTPPSVERRESALRWCRRVLDNPSPETEAACRSLMNRLDHKSSGHFYRRPAARRRNDSDGSSAETPPAGTTWDASDCADCSPLSYRLQDITDVHLMARIQEASLRQDYVSTPRRGAGAPVMFPSQLNTSAENREASSSSCWQSALSSLGSAPCQSPGSPRLSRLHQQVTQFKLLKLAQNRETSPARTRSPLRTSLRSLQAVRNSRSLEIEDYQPDSQTSNPPSAMSSTGSFPVRDSSLSSDRTAAVKRQPRSQSVSPCRIPPSAKAHLSGRVFALPEKSTTVAWAGNAPPTHG